MHHLSKGLITFFFLFFVQISFAQQHIHNHCLAHSIEESMPEALVNKIEQSLANERAAVAQKSAKSGKLIVPVVIHIIHNNGNENISYAQILEAMEGLNNDFNKLASDTDFVDANFKGIHESANIEFRLAKIDPNGNCTDGITRTVSSLTSSANDNVKSLIAWPRDKYFNVWIVRSIQFANGGTAGGYAYRPGFIPSPAVDGIVVNHNQFGSTGTSFGSGLAARTFAHEVGHWLGLPHTWGPTNDPGLASNCSFDDGIFDTPNTVGNSGSCNQARVTCGSQDNVDNIMDYSSCPKMFTTGQITLMRQTLNSPVAERNKLITTSNLIATGTNDGYVAASCVPELRDLRVDENNLCKGGSTFFSAEIVNINPDSLTFLWEFPGSNQLTSSAISPSGIQYDSGGVYDVILSLTTPDGLTTSDTFKNYISVKSEVNAPYFDDFTNGFPQNAQNGFLWTTDGTLPSQDNWFVSDLAGLGDSKSLAIKCSNYPNGTKRTIATSAIDFTSQATNPVIKFRFSYAKRNSQSEDVLRVYLRPSCNSTLTFPQPIGELSLHDSAISLNLTFDYIAPNDVNFWKEIEFNPLVNLSSFTGGVLLFELETQAGGGGNYLYIDSLYIGDPNLFQITSNKPEIPVEEPSLYPNPASESFTITVPESSDVNTMHVIDVSGKTLMSQDLNTGQNQIEATGLSKGIYIVHLIGDRKAEIRRLLIE